VMGRAMAYGDDTQAWRGNWSQSDLCFWGLGVAVLENASFYNDSHAVRNLGTLLKTQAR